MNKRKKQTEKFALQAMAIVMLWFIFLWVLMSLIACNNSQCECEAFHCLIATEQLSNNFVD